MIARSELVAFAIGVVLLTLGTVLYSKFKPVPATPGVHLPATPAPELKREETVPVLVAEPVQVYKPAVKAKLKLPPAVQADAKQHVVASTRTPNDDRQHTVTTVLDTGTGKFETYDRAEPLPWIGPGKRGSVRLTQWHNGVTQVDASRDLLRVKALHAGISGRADTSGETLVGAYVEWRF